MKKFFCALLAVIMMSSLTACSVLENNPISNLLERFTSSEEQTDVSEDEDDSYSYDVSTEEEVEQQEESDVLEEPEEPEEEPSAEEDSDDSSTTQVQPEVETQVETQTETTTTASEVMPDGASASSILDSQDGHNYWVSNVFDDSVTTAWIEAADGVGVGEYIIIYFDDGAAIQEIQLYNGYGGSYDNNGVIDVVEISIDTGGSMVYELDDYWNTIVFSQPVTTTTITLTILEAHTSDWEDTGISEILFYDYSDKEVTQNIE